MRYSRFSSHLKTIDAYKEWSQANGWDIDTTQLDRGSKRFETDAFSMGDLTIWRHYTDARVLDCYSPPPGQIEFSFSTLPDQASWCGVVLTDTVMVVTRGNRDYSVVSPPNMKTYGVTFPEELLKENDIFPEDLLDTFLIPEKAFFNSPNPFVVQLSQDIEKILSLTAEQNYFSDIETVIFSETIMSSLQKIVQLYTNKDNGGAQIKIIYKAELIDQTLEIFKANLKSPITVAEVACQLGVSRRSLENAFGRNLQVSPYSMFQIFRLHAVRDKLHQGLSVQEACAEFGITNFGRFSGQFSDHFGMLPSILSSLPGTVHAGRGQGSFN